MQAVEIEKGRYTNVARLPGRLLRRVSKTILMKET